jgi:hypothetical protein
VSRARRNAHTVTHRTDSVQHFGAVTPAPEVRVRRWRRVPADILGVGDLGHWIAWESYDARRMEQESVGAYLIGGRLIGFVPDTEHDTRKLTGNAARVVRSTRILLIEAGDARAAVRFTVNVHTIVEVADA